MANETLPIGKISELKFERTGHGPQGEHGFRATMVYRYDPHDLGYEAVNLDLGRIYVGLPILFEDYPSVAKHIQAMTVRVHLDGQSADIPITGLKLNIGTPRRLVFLADDIMNEVMWFHFQEPNMGETLTLEWP